MGERRIIILGAAGRDYHTFNTLFRDAPAAAADTVVAFTHAQIPHIESARYPPALAGCRYPDGIPIWREADLEAAIRQHQATHCIMAYSDVSYQRAMELAARVRAAGAAFELLGAASGMLPSPKPCVAVTATRTGCGKSQVCKYVVDRARAAGLRVSLVRHPMPYGDLAQQAVQRFATVEDLTTHKTTVEEREEYEQHINNGVVVFAGVDYGRILEAAAAEADVVLWDGGNNDLPFYKPDLWVCVADPHRPDAQRSFFPGDVNFRLADAIVINKADTAPPGGVGAVAADAVALNPTARVFITASAIAVDLPDLLKGKRVVCIDDGPTITHGGMPEGAAVHAARQGGAAEIVDPRPFFVGELAATLAAYPHIGRCVPAMGYNSQQLKDLEATINAVPCDAVVMGTPADLSRLIAIRHPVVRASYAVEDMAGAGPPLSEALDAFFARVAAVKADEPVSG